MSDIEKLKQTVESNFRLSILHTRELSAKVDQGIASLSDGMEILGHGFGDLSHRMDDMSQRMSDMGQRMDDMGQRMNEAGQRMDGMTRRIDAMVAKTREIRKEGKATLDSIADRHEATLSAIRHVLDNSVDLHKTVDDHEVRLRRLEERAS